MRSISRPLPESYCGQAISGSEPLRWPAPSPTYKKPGHGNLTKNDVSSEGNTGKTMPEKTGKATTETLYSKSSEKR